MGNINLSPDSGSFFNSQESTDARNLLKAQKKIEGRMYAAELKVTPEAITATVAATIDGNTLTSIINQTATTISIDASKINLSGYVTITNIGNGTTSIDGSNIKTGTISADRIAAGSIVAGKLSIGTLSAISSNLGTVNAGSINIGSGNFIVTTGGVITAKSGTIGGATFSGAVAGQLTLSGALSVQSIDISTTTGIAWFNMSNRTLSSPNDLLLYGNVIIQQGGSAYRLKISGTSIVAENVDAYI